MIVKDCYCKRCRQHVMPVESTFAHPHFRELKKCYLCPRCGEMVYYKEVEHVL